tara:strand:- start:15 stop:272 length:258 start_codon:yes stop_codon:yes gene_type:complete
MNTITTTHQYTDMINTESIALMRLNDLFGYVIAYTVYYLCVSLMLHSVYMDMKQGIFSRMPTLAYYYEDRDYVCNYFGKFVASLF